MPSYFILGLILTMAGFLVLFYYLNQKFRELRHLKTDEQSQGQLMLQNQINEVRAALDHKFGETRTALQYHFTESSKIIREVSERLVKLDETNKQVVNFAEQLQNLEDILKNPKQRGILGEYYLETLLKNILPPQAYEMQYKFSDGTMVDAVIFVKDKIVPIDSKFSLENYNKIMNEKDVTEREKLEKLFKADLKNRIDETAKYIKPSEGTVDFAFMFIPAEAIYYDLLVNQVGVVKVNTRDLIEYAFQEKRVIITSPTSFFAYLQTVLQGLRALEIEESAKEIRHRVEELGRHLYSFDDYMKRLGNNLSTTVNMYNSAYKELAKVDKDILRISGQKTDIEVLEIEKPKLEL